MQAVKVAPNKALAAIVFSITIMSELNETRLTLLRSIESLRDASRLHSDNKISRLIDTSASSTSAYKRLPSQIDLIPVRVIRFIIPITLTVIIASIALTAYSDDNEQRIALFISIPVFGFLLFLVIRHFWFNSNFKNKVIIDTVGISYNKTLYKWNDILTTHLEEVTYPREDHDPELYLLIGLSSGELKTLDISNFNFKNSFFRPLNSVRLANYIKQYKNNSR